MQIFSCTSFLYASIQIMCIVLIIIKNKIRHLVKYLHCIFLNNLFLFHVKSMANITLLVYLECVHFIGWNFFWTKGQKCLFFDLFLKAVV